ncbi:hypothetical protein C8R46DRAFT_1359386 [Mycena filopes]|nr:hypothetical protein C8R46DRAFT_1359386 [Mycena filopes]
MDRLTGVTFKLDGIPNMSNAMWAAVLNSLRLQRIPYRIHVGSNACLDPFLLQSFIRRHDSSWGPRVVLQSGALSISPGSILQPYPQPYSDGIGMLTAPAEYIPHLVHGGWRLCYLCLTTTNDLSGALTALAAQPNSDLEWLTLRIWDYHGRPTATSRKGRQT